MVINRWNIVYYLLQRPNKRGAARKGWLNSYFQNVNIYTFSFKKKEVYFHRLFSPSLHGWWLDVASWCSKHHCNVSSSLHVQKAKCVSWEGVPVPPEQGEEQEEEERGEGAAARFHHGRHAISHGGHKHQEHGHEGEEDVDKLAKQGTRRGVLQALKLHYLLLL